MKDGPPIGVGLCETSITELGVSEDAAHPGFRMNSSSSYKKLKMCSPTPKKILSFACKNLYFILQKKNICFDIHPTKPISLGYT
jgi:hypothetical protein